MLEIVKIVCYLFENEFSVKNQLWNEQWHKEFKYNATERFSTLPIKNNNHSPLKQLIKIYWSLLYYINFWQLFHSCETEKH